MVWFFSAIVTLIFYMGLAPGASEYYAGGDSGPQIILWIFGYLMCVGFFRFLKWWTTDQW